MDNKQSNRNIIILLMVIILVSATLRSPITSIGALGPFIKEDLNLSNTTIGFINTFPLIVFGLFSPFVSKITSKYGMENTLVIAMVMLVLGLWGRTVGDVFLLIIGTIIISLAIAIGNVTMPAIVKSSFSKATGIVTGTYSLIMNMVGALASGISINIALTHYSGWRFASQFWIVVPFVAIFILVTYITLTKNEHRVESETKNSSSHVIIWKSKLAWAITFYMGLQSLIPFTLFAWLPDILEDHSFSESISGWLITLMQFGLAISAFITPIVANKMKEQTSLMAGAGISFLIGLMGVLYIVNLWVALFLFLIGVGAGMAFSSTMILLVIRTSTSEESNKLSGMVQSLGYVLAALGPLSIGVIADIAQSWTVSIILLIVISIIIIILGYIIGPARKI